MQIPRHIAFSGAIAYDLQQVAQLIDEAYMNGAEHISLYDPWTELSAVTLAKLLKRRALSFEVHEIGAFGTRHVHSELSGDLISGDRLAESSHEGNVIVSVIRPGAGRQSLIRAARQLCADKRERTVEEVVEWLDSDSVDGMLPSEPDVLVVFPGGNDIRANVLHGFPPWQFRLTQIRFSETPISQMQWSTMLYIVGRAASAPKRFGR